MFFEWCKTKIRTAITATLPPPEMTGLDQFAGQAMQALLVKQTSMRDMDIKALSEESYRIARSMVASAVAARTP